MKVLLVYNPVSGKSINREQNLGNILLELGKSYNEITVYQTKSKGDGAEYLRNQDLSECELLIVCGGDGMLHEMVDQALKCEYKGLIGYIPMGSVNDFANNIGINEYNAVSNIIKKKSRKLDVGKFNDEHFNYVAAFGQFTPISYTTSQDAKNMIGHLAYFLEGIKELSEAKAIRICCETDNEKFEDDVLVGVISNTFSVGGVKLRKYMTELDDGEMEYIFIKYPQNLIDLQNTVFALLNGKFDSKYMYHGRSKRFEITSEPMEWNLDGEDGGNVDKAIIDIRRQALNIIAGR